MILVNNVVRLAFIITESGGPIVGMSIIFAMQLYGFGVAVMWLTRVVRHQAHAAERYSVRLLAVILSLTLLNVPTLVLEVVGNDSVFAPTIDPIYDLALTGIATVLSVFIRLTAPSEIFCNKSAESPRCRK